jgi:hypothetical protein
MNAVKRRVLALFGVASLVSVVGCAGGRLLYKDEIVSETVHSEYDASKLNLIAVLPDNPQRRFDYQIATRAIETLSQLGWSVKVAKGSTSRYTRVTDVCNDDKELDAIVLVTWNYMSLWDCETSTVAYEVDGGYAGVDKMAKQMTDAVRAR